MITMPIVSSLFYIYIVLFLLEEFVLPGLLFSFLGEREEGGWISGAPRGEEGLIFSILIWLEKTIHILKLKPDDRLQSFQKLYQKYFG